VSHRAKGTLAIIPIQDNHPLAGSGNFHEIACRVAANNPNPTQALIFVLIFGPLGVTLSGRHAFERKTSRRAITTPSMLKSDQWLDKKDCQVRQATRLPRTAFNRDSTEAKAAVALASAVCVDGWKTVRRRGRPTLSGACVRQGTHRNNGRDDVHHCNS
jgi:hypothetical protein